MTPSIRPVKSAHSTAHATFCLSIKEYGVTQFSSPVQNKQLHSIIRWQLFLQRVNCLTYKQYSHNIGTGHIAVLGQPVRIVLHVLYIFCASGSATCQQLASRPLYGSGEMLSWSKTADCFWVASGFSLVPSNPVLSYENMWETVVMCLWCAVWGR